MPKIQLNGFIEEVSDIEYVGQNNLSKQAIILMVPGYTDEYGEKKGKDEHYQISLLGDSVDKFNIHPRHVGSKVKTEVYIKSSRYTNKEGKVGYIVNINLASIEFIQSQARPQANQSYQQPVPGSTIVVPDQPQFNPGDNDSDLPF